MGFICSGSDFLSCQGLLSKGVQACLPAGLWCKHPDHSDRGKCDLPTWLLLCTVSDLVPSKLCTSGWHMCEYCNCVLSLRSKHVLVSKAGHLCPCPSLCIASCPLTAEQHLEICMQGFKAEYAPCSVVCSLPRSTANKRYRRPLVSRGMQRHPKLHHQQIC